MLVGPKERKNLWNPLVHNDRMPVLSLRHWIVHSLHLLVLFLDSCWLTSCVAQLLLTLESHCELMILEFDNRLLKLMEAPLVQIYALSFDI